MLHAEDRSANATTAPVFVDDTGRRRTLTRRVGRLLVIGFAGYLGLLATGFARDPRVGSLGLPTFGLPALHPEPAPVVLGTTTARTAAEATGAGEDPTTSGAGTARPAGPPTVPGAGGVPTGAPAAGGPGAPASGTAAETGTAAGAAPVHGPGVPAGGPATTTTTSATVPVRPGNGPKSTTTTTTAPTSSTTSPTTTSSTTTTTTTPGQGSGPVSAKGPDGAGAPGQDRKATTTTTGPRR